MSEKKRKGSNIPVLKNRHTKSEKKGGGVVVGQGSGGGGIVAKWFGVGARPGGSALSGAGRLAGRASIGGKGFGAGGMKLGLLPTAINAVSSNAGIALLTAAFTAVSVFTLFRMSFKDVKPPENKGAALFAQGGSAGDESDSALNSPGSLNFFRSANQGKAFNRGEAAAAGGEEIITEPEENIDEANADAMGGGEAGSGPEFAEEMAAALEKPKMLAAKGFGKPSSQLGGGVGLVGGSGMAGGVNRKFTPKPEKIAKVTPALQGSRKMTARSANRSISKVSGKGSMKQLRFANRRSVKALGAGSGEGQAFQAAEAFDTAPASADNEIAGAGVGDDGAGMTSGANNIADDGGPLGASETRGEAGVKKVGQSEDKSPYTGMLMMAQALLLAASTTIIIVGLLADLEKTSGPFYEVIDGMKLAFYAMAIGMAAAATAIGMMIMMQYGQNTQAMMVTAGGGITTAAALVALFSSGQTPAWLSVLGGIAGLGASIGSLLMPPAGGVGGNLK
jgi:hypothetical protein